MKIHPVGDGQTDTTKLVVAFRIFAFALANESYFQPLILNCDRLDGVIRGSVKYKLSKITFTKN